MRKANAKGAPGTHTYGTPSDCIGRAIKAECRGNECQDRPPLTVTVTVTVPVTGYWLLVTGYWLLVYWFTGLLVIVTYKGIGATRGIGRRRMVAARTVIAARSRL